MTTAYRWTQVFPATTPHARRQVAGVYFPPDTSVVMPGGNDGGTLIGTADRYDGTDWDAAGTPWPPAFGTAFGLHGVGYHPPSGKLVALVFHSGALQTWTFDGTTWTQLSPTHTPGPTFVAAQMKYMAGSVNALIACGGTYPGGCVGKSFETWSWNGTDWTQIATTHNPGTRAAFWLSTDGTSSNLYLFGGIDDCGTLVYYADTWVFNGTDWTQLTPTHSPSARRNTQYAYLAAPGVHYLQGGDNGSRVFSDSWIWNGTDWTQIVPCPNIGARAAAAFDYDAALGVGVLFGGMTTLSDAGEADTWELASVTAPAVTTGAASGNVCSTAVLNGTVTPNGSADVYFDYGTTTAYGTRVPAGTFSATSPVAVSATITGLTPGATYHFRVVAIPSGYCTEVDGSDAFFTEGACADHPTVNALIEITP